MNLPCCPYFERLYGKYGTDYVCVFEGIALLTEKTIRTECGRCSMCQNKADLLQE